MQRFVLAALRSCLSVWVGVAMYFVVVVVNVMESVLSDPPPALNKFNNPTSVLPHYYQFAFPLLGLALLCGFVSLWNARIGLVRRWATLLFVLVAFGMVALDHAYIYRNLAEIFASDATTVNANQVVALYQLSRLLKGAILSVSLVAAILAIWPEHTDPIPARKYDPAL